MEPMEACGTESARVTLRTAVVRILTCTSMTALCVTAHGEGLERYASKTSDSEMRLLRSAVRDCLARIHVKTGSRPVSIAGPCPDQGNAWSGIDRNGATFVLTFRVHPLSFDADLMAALKGDSVLVQCEAQAPGYVTRFADHEERVFEAFKYRGLCSPPDSGE